MDAILPGFADAYAHTHCTDWNADPFTLGAYSFPAPGEVTTTGPILYAGIGRLHFAGEHCSSAFVGYMEGALESGMRVVRRLRTRTRFAS